MDLAQEIADAVIAGFSSLKSGKPTIRLNGIPEWTVLAGLVAIEDGTVRLLTCATGVKAMPDETRAQLTGLVLHDLHAEILCLRMFNWLIMEEVCGRQAADLLEPVPDSDRFRLRLEVNLALYISEPPCGDALMSHISQNREPWEPSAKRQCVIRGRSNFDELGVVRTKPGRLDSRVSFSKSCSDKLCLKQFTGVLNAFTSLRVDPVYLDYLVLLEDQFSAEDYARCFTNRLAQKPNKLLTPLLFSKDVFEYGKAEQKEPLPLGIIHCHVTNTTQVLNNGVKNGVSLKKGPPRPLGASIVCRRNLWRQARGSIPSYSSYSELKRSQSERESTKSHARAQLDNWPKAGDDDFELSE